MKTRDRNDHRPGRLGDFRNLVDSRIMFVLAIKSPSCHGRLVGNSLGNSAKTMVGCQILVDFMVVANPALTVQTR